MNNAAKIAQMLEGMGFAPYPGNQHFQKPGYGQNWQKWAVRNKVEVYRKDQDSWIIVRRTNTGWHEVYSGKATPPLVREVLEVNGLVEKQQTPLTELKEAIDILTERKQTSQDPVFNEAIKTVVSAAKEHLAEQYRLIYEPNAGENKPIISTELQKAIGLLYEVQDNGPDKDSSYHRAFDTVINAAKEYEPNAGERLPSSEDFIAGIIWHDIERQNPHCYKTGDWDGKRSDFMLVAVDGTEIQIACAYEGTMNGRRFLDYYDNNDYEITGDITHWAEIPPIDFEDSPDQAVPHSPETKSFPEELADLMERFNISRISCGHELDKGMPTPFFVAYEKHPGKREDALFDFWGPPKEPTSSAVLVITPETLRGKANEKC